MEPPILQPSSAPALPPWHRAALYATVALMPLSVNAEKIVGSKSRFYLSPFEPLLIVLLFLMLLDILRHRERLAALKRHFWPALPVLLWALWALASCAWIPDFPSHDTARTWARAVFNPVIVGGAGTAVFIHAGRNAVELRRLCLVLLASAGICALLALFQYAGPPGLPFDPSQPGQDLGGASNIRVAGWYDFRALFGALMALIVPAATAFALLDHDSAVRSAASALAVIGLCITLSAGGFIGAVAGTLAVLAAALLLPGRARLAALAGLVILCVIAAAALPRLPRDNPRVLAANLALYAEMDGRQQPTARLRRYQSALDLLAAPRNAIYPDLDSNRPNWITGVGAGRYQENIKRFYQPPFDKPSHPTDDEAAFDRDADEPFTFGFLETTAVELGAPGLLLVLLLFAAWIASAAAGIFIPRDPQGAGVPDELPGSAMRRLAALAAFGAGVGALALSIFGNPVVRGVCGTFVFFLAAAIACRAEGSPPAIPAADLTSSI